MQSQLQTGDKKILDEVRNVMRLHHYPRLEFLEFVIICLLHPYLSLCLSFTD